MMQSISIRDVYCSLCYDKFRDDHPLRVLDHLIEEHRESEEFLEFVGEILVGDYCAKCGSWYTAGVELAASPVFLAPPYCDECLENNPALKDLLVEKIYPRDLLSRAWIPTETTAK